MNARFLALLLLAVIASSGFASAAGGIVGISPSTVYFKNILRGGYAERPITISYSQDIPVTVNLTAEGEIASWLNFTKILTVSKSQFARLVISVSPPSDMPNGNYNGFIVVSTSLASKSGQEGKAVGQVISVLQLAINVEVTDQEYLACTASDFFMDSAEQGDKLGLKLNVLNEGNIRLKPEIKIKIWNQDQTYVVKEIDLTGQEILPTKEQTLNFSIGSRDFDISQYWASVEVPQCYASATLTFDVLEEGALKSNLILLRMYTIPSGRAGETIPVIVDYQNLGEKEVEAQFKGQVALNGKIVQVLENDKFLSPIGDKNNITLYFTPEKAGKYVISGRLFYDKKRTFESSTTIDIIAGSSTIKTILLILLYLAIITVMIFLLIKIKQEKEAYLEKLRLIRR
jgi:hypothetical protein